MNFAKYVDEDTISRAGFNYWEESYGLKVPGSFYSVAYHSQVEGVNIVVAEVMRTGSDNRKRTEFFFDTFEGPHTGQCRNEDAEEYQAFMANLNAVPRRRNRIAGRDLKQKIIDTVD